MHSYFCEYKYSLLTFNMIKYARKSQMCIKRMHAHVSQRGIQNKTAFLTNPS